MGATTVPRWKRIATQPLAWFWSAVVACLPYPRFSPTNSRVALVAYSAAYFWVEYAAGRIPVKRGARG